MEKGLHFQTSVTYVTLIMSLSLPDYQRNLDKIVGLYLEELLIDRKAQPGRANSIPQSKLYLHRLHII